MAMARTIPIFLCFTVLFYYGQCALQLSSYFGDHMVLQHGPQQAVLWGTADTEGDTVTAQVTGQSSRGAQVTVKVSQGQWKVKLPAQDAGGPYTVHVSSRDGDVTLNDVLFGDVWLCSGQSNMGVKMNQIMNATQEIQTAQSFSQVRFSRHNFTQATSPQTSVEFNIPWTTSSARVFPYYSAVCFLFGEYLYSHVKRPIGLVLSYWGGTHIESWSPPQAIQQCQHHQKRGPSGDSILWNSMIHPLLSATIAGAIWYQGETNAKHSELYSCQIVSMLKEWREQFHHASLNQTSTDFPFGYVQLAANGPGDEVGFFPGERWAQTAGYGYSPNPVLRNTFMAVAMDLPDFDSPGGTIHPRFKQDVAERLVRGALNVAYGQTSVTFQGPFPTGLTPAPRALHVVYDKGQANLTVVNTHGFEVCCSVHNTTHCDDRHDAWVAAPISSHQTSQVTLDTSGCGSRHVVGMRYEWRTSPCAFKQCALYDAVTGLPAPTYISHNMAANTGPNIIG